jgi:hypothetical protein
MVRHATAIQRAQRRMQGVNDPPDTAFAILMDELKGSRHPTLSPHFKPSWTNR